MGDSMGVQLGTIPITYMGYFDFKKIYKFVLKFMSDEDLKYTEPLYKAKPSDGGTKEYEIQMHGENEIDGFHKFSVDVTLQAWNVADVEVEIDGKMVKTNRGRIIISISGEIERDWQGMYEHSPFHQKIRKLLFQITGNDEDFKYWGTYNEKIQGLQNDLKILMNIPTHSK